MIYPDYRKMSSSDIAEWQERATAVLQSLEKIESPSSWDDVPESLWNDSCEVATAYVTVRTFIESSRKYSPARAISLMRAYISEILTRTSTMAPKSRGTEKPAKINIAREKPSHVVEPDLKNNTPVARDDDRPQHLADYMYMLPEELQVVGDSVEQLYLELSDYRQQAERIAEQLENAEPNTDEEAVLRKKLEALANKTVETEQKRLRFWSMVDKSVEYYKANGKVVDYASLLPKPQAKQMLLGKRMQECTKAEIDAIEDTALQEEYRLARIDSNKRYLRRKDILQSEEWLQQTRLRYEELIAWGVTISKKIEERLRSTGIIS